MKKDDETHENRLDQTVIQLPTTDNLKSPFNQTSKLGGKIPKCVRFILDNGTNLDAVARAYITVGRKDEKRKEHVDIDLNPHGARENGVSRCHAIVSVLSAGVFLKDFNSTNGTSINDAELYPMREYALQNGDTIVFGRLKTTVKFIF